MQYYEINLCFIFIIQLNYKNENMVLLRGQIVLENIIVINDFLH